MLLGDNIHGVVEGHDAQDVTVLVRTAAFPDAPMFEEQLFTGCFNIAAIICLVSNMSAVIYLMVLFWRDEHDLNTSGTAMNVIEKAQVRLGLIVVTPP